MSNLRESKQIRVGLAAQSAFGTPVASNGAFEEIKGTMEITYDPKVYDVPGGGSRYQKEAYMHTHFSGSMPSVKISGPFQYQGIELILRSFFGKATQSGSNPYIYAFSGSRVQEDFVLTGMKGFPTANQSQRVNNLNVTSFVVSGEVGSAEPVMMEAEGTGFGPTLFAQAPTYTAWTQQMGLTHPNRLHFKVNTGSGLQDLRYKTFKISGTKSTEGVGSDGAGGFQAPGDSEITLNFEFTVMRDDILPNIETNFGTSQTITLELYAGDGTVSTAGEWKFTLTGKSSDIKPEESGLIAATITGKCLADNHDDNDTGFLFQVCNNKNRSW